MGYIYILGFGFDFSEIDLWWLLNRKKREKAKHGGFYFYEPTSSNNVKIVVMETYGGELKNMGFEKKPPDYRSFYQKAIEDIQLLVEEKKGIYALA